MTETEFWHSTLRRLNAHTEAYNNIRRIKDEEAWKNWKYYGVSALTVSVDHCISKNANSKFIEQPLLTEIGKDTESISEASLKVQRELLAMNLKVAEKNFNLKKNRERLRVGDKDEPTDRQS